VVFLRSFFKLDPLSDLATVLQDPGTRMFSAGTHVCCGPRIAYIPGFGGWVRAVATWVCSCNIPVALTIFTALIIAIIHRRCFSPNISLALVLPPA